MGDRMNAKGRPDLTGYVFVQEVSASHSTTTSTTTSFIDCEEGSQCISQSCITCDHWRSLGYECQGSKNLKGDCMCSCINVGSVTRGPPARTSAAAYRRTGFLFLVAASACLTLARC